MSQFNLYIKMKFLKEVQDKVTKLVSEARINEAFDMLIEYGIKDAITMKANFVAAKKANSLGTISYSEYSKKLSQATTGIMSLIGVEAPDMDGITVYKNAEKAKQQVQTEEEILRNGALNNPAFMLAHYGKALRLTHADLVVKLHEKYMELMEESAQVAFGFKVPTEPVLDEELLTIVYVADAELRKLKNDWKDNVRQLVSTKSFPSPENIDLALKTCQANGLLKDLQFNVELSGWAIQAQILQQINLSIQ